MAAIDVSGIGVNQSKGIDYSWTTDVIGDATGVPNDTYFYNFGDSLPYYKDGTGTVISIFAAGGGADGNGIFDATNSNGGSFIPSGFTARTTDTFGIRSSSGTHRFVISPTTNQTTIGSNTLGNTLDVRGGGSSSSTAIGIIHAGNGNGNTYAGYFIGGAEGDLWSMKVHAAEASSGLSPQNFAIFNEDLRSSSADFAIEHDTGNVGINAPNPSAKLHVVGTGTTFECDGNAQIDGDLDINGGKIAVGTGAVTTTASVSTGTDLGSKFHIYEGVSPSGLGIQAGKIQFFAGSTNEDFVWGVGTSASLTEKMYLDTGNTRLGIGTSSPSDTLHVNGSVRIDDTTTTSATAGTNGDVPAQVDGYLTININGFDKKIPYYNA